VLFQLSFLALQCHHSQRTALDEMVPLPKNKKIQYQWENLSNIFTQILYESLFYIINNHNKIYNSISSCLLGNCANICIVWARKTSIIIVTMYVSIHHSCLCFINVKIDTGTRRLLLKTFLSFSQHTHFVIYFKSTENNRAG